MNKIDLGPAALPDLGAPALAVSARTGEGMSALFSYLREGRTVAFVGSSGVGKSTLVNALVGDDVFATQDIYGGKGRHTTTRRQLVVLPRGGVLIDTPGMRELGLAAGDPASVFREIAAAAPFCRFRDCTHAREPGCAVRAAIERGELEEARLRSFHKLERELARVTRQDDPRARAESKRQIKARHRRQRLRNKNDPKTEE